MILDQIFNCRVIYTHCVLTLLQKCQRHPKHHIAKSEHLTLFYKFASLPIFFSTLISIYSLHHLTILQSHVHCSLSIPQSLLFPLPVKLFSQICTSCLVIPISTKIRTPFNKSFSDYLKEAVISFYHIIHFNYLHSTNHNFMFTFV